MRHVEKSQFLFISQSTDVLYSELKIRFGKWSEDQRAIWNRESEVINSWCLQNCSRIYSVTLMNNSCFMYADGLLTPLLSARDCDLIRVSVSLFVHCSLFYIECQLSHSVDCVVNLVYGTILR